MGTAHNLPKGKLRGEALRKTVLRHLPMLSESSTINLDYSKLSTTGKDLIISCDPIIGIPPEYYGLSAIHVPGADIAVAGVRPRYLELGVYYPPDYPVQWLDRNMRALGEEAKRLGIKIVGGHTGGYDGLSLPIISSTCIGVVEGRLLSPSMIQAGDRLVVSGPVTHELAIFLSYVETKMMEKLLGTEKVVELRTAIKIMTIIEPALAVSDAGARAMHDIAEGGTALALEELSEACGLGITVDYDQIPWSKEGFAVANAYGADPLSTSSFGSLLIACPEENIGKVVAALQEQSRPAREVGQFRDERGVFIKRGKRESRLEIKEDIYGQFTTKL